MSARRRFQPPSPKGPVDETVLRELIAAIDQVALQLRLVRAVLAGERPPAPRDPPEAREFLPWHPPSRIGKLMATKRIELERLANGQGCLGRADEDEPLFILRAQDRLAAPLVRLWADLAHQLGCPKALEAHSIAAEMDDWGKAHPDRLKWPD